MFLFSLADNDSLRKASQRADELLSFYVWIQTSVSLILKKKSHKILIGGKPLLRMSFYLLFYVYF